MITCAVCWSPRCRLWEKLWVFLFFGVFFSQGYGLTNNRTSFHAHIICLLKNVARFRFALESANVTAWKRNKVSNLCLLHTEETDSWAWTRPEVTFHKWQKCECWERYSFSEALARLTTDDCPCPSTHARWCNPFIDWNTVQVQSNRWARVHFILWILDLFHNYL